MNKRERAPVGHKSQYKKYTVYTGALQYRQAVESKKIEAEERKLKLSHLHRRVSTGVLLNKWTFISRQSALASTFFE